eukprot:TRINITY_DN20400_c0_g1::TRINITY_DN20400_c0_g1_i1::g.8416::m.8416 TRINITY_DN20400_c0_g1::TRINITY_DN20400_c0_g1_i1::g.8416  ORF type:complete len:101 (-),score=-15.80,LRRNT_2/PF08263.7/0.026 TRINITY_DN20400_c0_g1_i1:201-503(-)
MVFSPTPEGLRGSTNRWGCNSLHVYSSRFNKPLAKRAPLNTAFLPASSNASSESPFRKSSVALISNTISMQSVSPNNPVPENWAVSPGFCTWVQVQISGA